MADEKSSKPIETTITPKVGKIVENSVKKPLDTREIKQDKTQNKDK